MRAVFSLPFAAEVAVRLRHLVYSPCRCKIWILFYYVSSHYVTVFHWKKIRFNAVQALDSKTRFKTETLFTTLPFPNPSRRWEAVCVCVSWGGVMTSVSVLLWCFDTRGLLKPRQPPWSPMRHVTLIMVSLGDCHPHKPSSLFKIYFSRAVGVVGVSSSVSLTIYLVAHYGDLVSLGAAIRGECVVTGTKGCWGVVLVGGVQRSPDPTLSPLWQAIKFEMPTRCTPGTGVENMSRNSRTLCSQVC